MELIYNKTIDRVCIAQEILDKYDLIKADFLGKVTIEPNEYISVEDNYFNQMLIQKFGIAENFPDKYLSERLSTYQRADVAKSLGLQTFCNFNRMGYGKTVETVEHMHIQSYRKVLIVAPKAVHTQWKDHIKEWYPELHPWVTITKSGAALRGTLEHYKNSNLNTRMICIIINYEKLLQGPIITALRSCNWDFLVFDEAHYLKNRDSKRTKAAMLIPAQNRCLLTGTPVLSHYDNLWSMLNCLGWKYSGKHYWPFVEKFCEVKDGFFGREIVGPTRNERDLNNFKKYIDLISIRNPDLQLTQGKRVVTVPLQMEKNQKLFYNKIKKILLEDLPDDLTIANGAVKCVRLRQATSCPRILDEEQKSGTKFEWVKNFVENTNEQVLILTQFASTVRLLAKYLGEDNCAIHIGTMNSSQRNVAINEFIRKSKQVLIATTQSIGVGVDGLQNCCRLGIVIDADYSPEINRQAEDRLDRLGQKDLVVWYYLECEHTFDKRVQKINDCKNKSIRELIMED